MVCEIAKELDAVIIKGVRNTTDFDYEYNLSLINRSAGDVETLLLPASPETAFISSTMVREFLRLEKDVTKYIPKNTKIERQGSIRQTSIAIALSPTEVSRSSSSRKSI